jgi:hypothetical protein
VTDIILVPGMWLDGSSWEAVPPVLERAGHGAHPLTLPTGHWPQFTRPSDLGQAILASITSRTA